MLDLTTIVKCWIIYDLKKNYYTNYVTNIVTIDFAIRDHGDHPTVGSGGHNGLHGTSGASRGVAA